MVRLPTPTAAPTVWEQSATDLLTDAAGTAHNARSDHRRGACWRGVMGCFGRVAGRAYPRLRAGTRSTRSAIRVRYDSTSRRSGPFLHDNQIDIDSNAVRLLLADQFPELVDPGVSRLPGAGTVNAIFRIGRDHVARLPLQLGEPAEVAASLRNEQRAAAELADAISPLGAPRPIALGEPGRGYPLPWSIQTWVPGETATAIEPEGIARALATVIKKLRRVPVRNRPFSGHGRGGNLTSHDDWVEECLSKSTTLIDTTAARQLWAELRELPRSQPDAMTHGDLIQGNVLTHEGELVGLLDTGGFGPADPALDTIAAWHLFDDGARAVFRDTLGCDDLEWQRSRAWAFQQALGAGWYYEHTNQAMFTMGMTTLSRLLPPAR